MKRPIYNEGSPITLLSEYQIREHKYVIDSVARKHKISPNAYGTQRLVLSNLLHIPFEDRGGIMGFEILPIKEDDINDVFELTSSLPWKPRRFRVNNLTSPELITTEEAPKLDPKPDPEGAIWTANLPSVSPNDRSSAIDE